jgi:hypothetical protein
VDAISPQLLTWGLLPGSFHFDGEEAAQKNGVGIVATSSDDDMKLI